MKEEEEGRQVCRRVASVESEEETASPPSSRSISQGREEGFLINKKEGVGRRIGSMAMADRQRQIQSIFEHEEPLALAYARGGGRRRHP